jgi:hypothetical protein
MLRSFFDTPTPYSLGRTGDDDDHAERHDTRTYLVQAMTALTKLAPFAAVLAVLYAGGYAAGTVIDADVETAPAHGHTDDELRLRVDDTRFDPGTAAPLAFRVEDADGTTVRRFDTEHEKRMHVIVVRRDLSGFQHIHPEQTRDGGWIVPLTLREPGTYRVFTDFSTGGESRLLQADVTAPGQSSPRVIPHPSDTAKVDGYEVTLAEDGDDARFTVRRDGRVLDDVEPYLGARGHLVALRQGDLEYLHVHPKDEATAGRDISFGIEYPSKGTYRLFLQFQHEGRVHTAEFTRQGGGSDGHGH